MCVISRIGNVLRLKEYVFFSYFYLEIHVTENRKSNQEWTIQRHWKQWVHKTKANKA